MRGRCHHHRSDLIDVKFAFTARPLNRRLYQRSGDRRLFLSLSSATVGHDVGGGRIGVSWSRAGTCAAALGRSASFSLPGLVAFSNVPPQSVGGRLFRCCSACKSIPESSARQLQVKSRPSQLMDCPVPAIRLHLIHWSKCPAGSVLR